MSAIEASSVKVSTMADGTLRIVCDIEPCHAQAAFALFGAPGTPMALAALKVGHAAASDEEVKPKSGAPKTAQDAALVCKNPEFWRYARFKGYAETEDGAKQLIYTFCGIESRAELNDDPVCAQRFGQLMAKFRDYKIPA